MWYRQLYWSFSGFCRFSAGVSGVGLGLLGSSVCYSRFEGVRALGFRVEAFGSAGSGGCGF